MRAREGSQRRDRDRTGPSFAKSPTGQAKAIPSDKKQTRCSAGMKHGKAL